MRSLRRAVLTRCFELLYGPLVLLHEPLGVLAYGDAWKGRRAGLASGLVGDGGVIEVGAGEGFLVRCCRQIGVEVRSYEPSAAMRQRAWKRSTGHLAAPAQELPLPDGSVDVILASFPGPWILEQQTWLEFARVLREGGTVRILAGGSFEGGRAGIRNRLLALAYGRSELAPPKIAGTGEAGIHGDWSWEPDLWGAALIWTGRRGRLPPEA